MVVAFQQQPADGGRQRCAVEIMGRQRRRRARGLDIVDEAVERVGRERTAGDRAVEGTLQLAALGQPGLARALHRLAGQVARGGIETGDRPVRAQLGQRGLQAFQYLQCHFGIARFHRDEVTHVGRAEFAAQLRIARECGRRHGREARQVVLPERARRPPGDRDRGGGEEVIRGATQARPAREPLPQFGQAQGVGSVARRGVDQARQQEARGQRGHAEASDGEHGQLLQAVDARNQEGEVGDAGRCHAGAQRRPQRARARPGRQAGALVREQVDRIVLGDADQGEAEGDGDAVHAIEEERDRGQSRQATARQRQAAEQRRLPAAVRQPQQQDENHAVDGADPTGFLRGAAADLHRERTRPAEGEATAAVAGHLREGGADRIDRGLLALGIETGGARFDRQQRFAPGAVEPDSVQALRCIRGLPGFRELECFQGGIARQQRLDQCGRGRPQVLHALAEFGAEECAVEAMRVGGIGEQVAVRTQALGNCFEAGITAVGDQLELRLRKEPFAQRRGLHRERLRIAAGQRHQQQARTRALAQLVDQQLLRAGFRGRHELAQVATEFDAAAEPPAGERQYRQPQQCQRQARTRRHRRQLHCALAPP